MINSKEKFQSNASVKLNGVVLEKVKEIKYLGVIIDNKLNMKEHLDLLILVYYKVEARH